MHPRLPIELYRHILDHVDDTDTLSVRSLMLSNRFMHTEAEPLLYHTLIVSTSQSNVRSYLSTYQARLDEKPSLASHVVRLHLMDFSPIYSGDDETGESVVIEGVFDDLDILVRRMPSLSEMVIQDLYGRPRTTRFLRTIPARLTSLVYETQAVQAHVQFGELLGALGGSHHAFRRLDLHSRGEGDMTDQSVWTPLPSPDLDRLFQDVVSLGGDDVIICRLLPRCPNARRVRWYAPNAFLPRSGFMSISSSKLVQKLGTLDRVHIHSWMGPRRVEVVDQVVKAVTTALGSVELGLSYLDRWGHLKTSVVHPSPLL